MRSEKNFQGADLDPTGGNYNYVPPSTPPSTRFASRYCAEASSIWSRVQDSVKHQNARAKKRKRIFNRSEERGRPERKKPPKRHPTCPSHCLCPTLAVVSEDYQAMMTAKKDSPKVTVFMILS